jgi:hypothetical protein
MSRHFTIDDQIESVIGPVEGYYVFSYVVQCGDGFSGYAKVMDELPPDFWSGRPLAKLAVHAMDTRTEARRGANIKAFVWLQANGRHWRRTPTGQLLDLANAAWAGRSPSV